MNIYIKVYYIIPILYENMECYTYPKSISDFVSDFLR